MIDIETAMKINHDMMSTRTRRFMVTKCPRCNKLTPKKLGVVYPLICDKCRKELK
jgi:endogenous inhibitor of DNA gyrase (YacG/DUF329 family)